MSEVFSTLSHTDVNGKSESKNGLKYLSWAWAWAEVKKAFPDANYIVHEYDGKPYLHDENLGYMVSTKVTINGETIPMHLPVMDGANKAQKSTDYTYDTKFKKGVLVKSATMFDINKAIMRCLVKNLAMFGLGLYIYAGEDLPEAGPDIPTDIDRGWIGAIKSGANKLEDILDANHRSKIKSFIEKGV